MWKITPFIDSPKLADKIKKLDLHKTIYRLFISFRKTLFVFIGFGDNKNSSYFIDNSNFKNIFVGDTAIYTINKYYEELMFKIAHDFVFDLYNKDWKTVSLSNSEQKLVNDRCILLNVYVERGEIGSDNYLNVRVIDDYVIDLDDDKDNIDFRYYAGVTINKICRENSLGSSNFDVIFDFKYITFQQFENQRYNE